LLGLNLGKTSSLPPAVAFKVFAWRTVIYHYNNSFVVLVCDLVCVNLNEFPLYLSSFIHDL